jgi:hypothetical protein
MSRIASPRAGSNSGIFFCEIHVVANDHGERRRNDLGLVAIIGQRRKFLFAFGDF